MLIIRNPQNSIGNCYEFHVLICRDWSSNTLAQGRRLQFGPRCATSTVDPRASRESGTRITVHADCQLRGKSSVCCKRQIGRPEVIGTLQGRHFLYRRATRETSPTTWRTTGSVWQVLVSNSGARLDFSGDVRDVQSRILKGSKLSLRSGQFTAYIALGSGMRVPHTQAFLNATSLKESTGEQVPCFRRSEWGASTKELETPT